MKKSLLLTLTSTIILSTFLPATQAFAADIDSLESQKSSIQQEQTTIESQISDAEARISSLEGQSQTLTAEAANLTNQLTDLLNQLAAKEAELAATEARLEVLAQEIKELEVILANRMVQLEDQARFLQTDGNVSNLLEIVLAAEDFSDAINRVTTVSKLVDANKENVEKTEVEKQKLADKKAEQEAIKLEQEQLRDEILVAKNNVAAQKYEVDNKIAEINASKALSASEKASLVSQFDSLSNETAKIENEISDILAEQARAKAEAEKKAAEERAAAAKAAEEAAAKAQEIVYNEPEPIITQTSTSTISKPAGPTSGTGQFINPASGVLTSPFGYRTNPVLGYSELHTGIDIGGSGAILAADGGTVIVATNDGNGFGYYVMIDHGNGFVTLYGHMQPGLSVYPGQKVSRGQQVGVMGTTGLSTGVHLHFEIRLNGSFQNPLNYVSY